MSTGNADSVDLPSWAATALLITQWWTRDGAGEDMPALLEATNAAAERELDRTPEGHPQRAVLVQIHDLSAQLHHEPGVTSADRLVAAILQLADAAAEITPTARAP